MHSNPTLLAAFDVADTVGGTGLELAFSALLYAVFVLVPVLALSFGLHFFLSLPMRRRERARFFLDLLETGLRRGDSPERMIVEMSAARDRSPGVRFHLLAAHLEAGLPLEVALVKVPRLVPPSVAAILQAGKRLGNLRGVLPACRQILSDSQSSVRSATSYAAVLLLTLSPAAIWVTWIMFIMIVPKFREVLIGMEMEHPVWAAAIWAHPYCILLPQLLLFSALLVAAFFYIGGPRAVGWLRLGSPIAADWFAWRLPWKRHRLQRTFSVMLATLLDGGMSEAEAVTLTADCTANEVICRRAAKVTAALARGEALPDAIASVDQQGEFRWRLKNAARGLAGVSRFLRALTGWHQSLEARAFREEQTAAHLVTTGLVLVNGLIVAAIAIAIFGSIVAITEGGILW